MAVSSKLIAFQKSGTTAPASFTQTLTGAGFTPKGAIFWSVASDSSFTDNHRPGYGFSDGTNNRAVAWATNDNNTTTRSARVNSDDACFLDTSANGIVAVQFKVIAWTADGCTIQYDINDNSSYDIFVWFFGGADILNVKAGTFNASTVTGTQTITDPGFTPSMDYCNKWSSTWRSYCSQERQLYHRRSHIHKYQGDQLNVADSNTR